MAMTMQRVDDRHKLSLPLFYPHYKPGFLKSRSSKDVQFLEASPRSSRSSRSSHSTRQHSESNPNRSTETSLKSCLRKSSEKHTNNKDNNFTDNDAKSGHLKETDIDRKEVNCLKHTDCDVHLYAATGDNGSRFPTKKWRATKVDTSSDDSKENREMVKMKGCGYTRFRYPLRFHYGSSVQQTRSGVISAIPAGLRTSSFYSNLPRRQKSVQPGSLSNEKNRRGKDEKQRREKERSSEEKTEVENDGNSRAASPERELNGVYHVIHEAQERDIKVEKKQRSRTATRENRSRTTRNQSDDDDDDDEVPEVKVKDNDEVESSRRSSRSSQPDRSEESIKEAGSSSEKEKLKNDDGSSDDDDVDLRRDRKVEKRKSKKKRKKSSGRDKIETEYAADFDDEKSETFSRDH